MKASEIKNKIENEMAVRKNGAWAKGVYTYALELLDEFVENYSDDDEITDKKLRHGASDWKSFSWGGCSLIYDAEIAKRLCNATELKKTNNGERKPNKREEWLDTQARALWQAARLIMRFSMNNNTEGGDR